MVFVELKKAGIECEMITIGDGLSQYRSYETLSSFLFVSFFAAPTVKGCRGCNACKTAGKCVQAAPGDPVNEWFPKMLEADGVILGSPTHFAAVSVEMKSLIDRLVFFVWFCSLF